MKSLSIFFALLLLSLVVFTACTSKENTTQSGQQNKVNTPIDNEVNNLNVDNSDLDNSDLNSLDSDLSEIENV